MTDKKKRLNRTEEQLKTKTKKHQSHSEWCVCFGKTPRGVMDKEYGKIGIDFFQPYSTEAQEKVG